jgi:hypothetical protein
MKPKYKRNHVTYRFPFTDDAGSKVEMLSVVLKWIKDNVPKDAEYPRCHHIDDGLEITWYEEIKKK